MKHMLYTYFSGTEWAMNNINAYKTIIGKKLFFKIHDIIQYIKHPLDIKPADGISKFKFRILRWNLHIWPFSANSFAFKRVIYSDPQLV